MSKALEKLKELVEPDIFNTYFGMYCDLKIEVKEVLFNLDLLINKQQRLNSIREKYIDLLRSINLTDRKEFYFVRLMLVKSIRDYKQRIKRKKQYLKIKENI